MTQRQNDFLQPLLETMQRNSDRQDKRLDELTQKIDANTVTTDQVLQQARYTNGRVTQNEADIKALQSQVGRKLSLQPNVMYLIALGAVLLLIIIASLLHVNLGGIIK